MKLPTSGPEWERRVAEAIEEAGMSISAGTGRGDYDPDKLRALAFSKLSPADLDLIKGLVERNNKMDVIDAVSWSG